MKRSTFIGWMFASLFLGLSVTAQADSLSSVKLTESAGVEASRPLTFFGSIGSGYGGVAGSDYADTPVGPHALISGLGAIQFSRWELDGGVSWFFSSISGRVVDGLPVRVRTRSGTVDLGARYRITSRLQAGPALNFAFGADTSFGPSVGRASVEPLFGIKGLYELPVRGLPVRFWSQLSANVSSKSHLMVALAGVQLGFPVSLSGRAETSGSRDMIVASSSAPTPASRRVSVALDGQRIFFGTSSTQLRPELVRTLKRVGSYLGESSSQFGQVRVDGHADQRGPFEMNLRLSRQRAQAVGDALVAGGIDPEAMAVEGFGYLNPLDPLNARSAWAKNRRVELVFEDVQNPDALREVLKPLALEAPQEKR